MIRVALLLLLVAAPAVTASYSAFDARPDGYSALRRLARDGGHPIGTTALTTESLDDEPGPDTLYVSARRSPLEPAQTAALGRFVGRGGSLLLATDLDTAGDLLMTWHLRVVAAPLVADGSAGAFEARGAIGGTEYRLLAQRPSAVRLLPGFEGTVVAATANETYVDLGNGTIAAENEAAGFPLAVLAGPRDGLATIALLSDPDLLSNAALENATSGNSAWADALLGRLVPPKGRIVFDESEQLATAPVRLTHAFARIAFGSAPLVAALGAGVAALLAFAARLGRSTGPTKRSWGANPVTPRTPPSDSQGEPR